MEKIAVLADRMALSKLTLHTAMAYIDRLVVMQHGAEGLRK